MTTFNLGISSNDAIKDNNPFNSGIKHTSAFNSRIKHRKAQGSTMKVYQPLDHVQINQEHTFEFGRWKSMARANGHTIGH